MPTVEELLSQIDANTEPDLTLPEKILGYSRSYLSGPLMNYADEAEAGIASLFTPLTYDQELANIRSEQERFKRKTDYLDNALEIGSSIALNPLGELGALAKGSSMGNIAAKVASNPVTQAAIAGSGAADEDRLSGALNGALVGTVLSGGASIAGKTLEKAGKEADRLKLSAFGIGYQDIKNQLKKHGDAYIKESGEVPFVNIVDKAEKQGVIGAGNEVAENLVGVLNKQDEIGAELNKILGAIDDNSAKTSKSIFSGPLKPIFGEGAPTKSTITSQLIETPATNAYIASLSGTARNQATKAAQEELKALSQQIGSPTLGNLQKLKIGLNYKYDKNPYTEDIIKSLRSDLKNAIESKADNAARSGLIDADTLGKVKELNKEWGGLAELRDAFNKKLASNYGGDVVEDFYRGFQTTGGTGSFNIMAATSGNPIWAVLGQGLNVLRYSENKSGLADYLRAFQKPLKKTGEILLGEGKIPAPITARSGVQIAESLKPTKSTNEVKSLLDLIDQELGAQGSGARSQDSDIPQKGQKQSQKDQQPKESTERLSVPENLDIPSLFQPTGDSGPSQSGSIFDLVDEDQLLDALREVESGGGKYLLSSAGAKGPYQFTDATAKDYGLTDPFDEALSRLAAKKKLSNDFKKLGDLQLTLAAYNAGLGRVQGALKKSGGSTFKDIAPYLADETQNYPRLIEMAMRKVQGDA